MRPNDQNLMRKWANDHGKCDRQRIVRQETTKFKAVTLPLNMYETAVHGGERFDFAQNEDSEVPKDDERKDGSPSGISEAVQLSEYQDDSSDDNDCLLEEDGARRASTSKQRTRLPLHSNKNEKQENGEDIEQGS